jgi:hypothetical protein
MGASHRKLGPTGSGKCAHCRSPKDKRGPSFFEAPRKGFERRLYPSIIAGYDSVFDSDFLAVFTV